MAYRVPNHTQTPNELFDEHMKDMSGSELKVVLAVCRKTFGWHKEHDRISLTQLMETTGLSRPAVITGIKKAMARGVLARRKIDSGFEYGLILTGSKKSLLGASSKSLLVHKGKGSKKSLHTKEKIKKYPYNKLKKNYLNDEFADFIEN